MPFDDFWMKKVRPVLKKVQFFQPRFSVMASQTWIFTKNNGQFLFKTSFWPFGGSWMGAKLYEFWVFGPNPFEAVLTTFGQVLDHFWQKLPILMPLGPFLDHDFGQCCTIIGDLEHGFWRFCTFWNPASLFQAFRTRQIKNIFSEKSHFCVFCDFFQFNFVSGASKMALGAVRTWKMVFLTKKYKADFMFFHVFVDFLLKLTSIFRPLLKGSVSSERQNDCVS